MQQPINDELLAAWRALAAGKDATGWRSIALTGPNGGRVRAARRFPENTEALFVNFGGASIPPVSQLPQAAGFRVETVATGMDGNWLALFRQTDGELDLFTRIASDVVGTLATTSSADDRTALHLFLRRIRAWLQFMSRTSGLLSAEAELGLHGELACIGLLLDAGIGSWALLDGWRGPHDGLRDIEIGSAAIEVKSTLSQVGFIARIASIEQLDDSVFQPLFVCASRFALAQNGLTLAGRIEDVRSRLSGDPAALEVLDIGLLAAGYREMDALAYPRQIALVSVRFIAVGSGFPRLVPGNVPPGVRNVRYDIDLDIVDGAALSALEVMKMIGAADGVK
jgi:hypothetical protein